MTCWNPFYELRCNVSVYTTCCPAWLDPSAVVGRWDNATPEIETLRPWEVWNHRVFQSLRQAVLAGDFTSYCQPCSRIIAGHLEGTIQPWMKPIMEQPPKRLWLEHDRHCQLACPSCRTHVDGHLADQDKRDAKVLEICREFLPTAAELTLMTSGDPLVSRSSLEVLSWLPQFPHLDVELFTNGLLLPSKWQDLHAANIRRLNFSVDAATADTYERVRWPAKWHQVDRSLKFASRLRSAGTLSRVQLNFVVQAANFREIPAFIRMTEHYGFDVAHLAAILQVYHSATQYASLNICDPVHPEHEEFLQVMQCDELSHPTVLFPTIRHFRHV